jgi:hypothetical protein
MFCWEAQMLFAISKSKRGFQPLTTRNLIETAFSYTANISRKFGFSDVASMVFT